MTENTPINEELDQSHPLEPIMEASLHNNHSGHENTGKLLEAILEQNSNNDLTPLMEASLIQGTKNTDKIIEAIQKMCDEMPDTPEMETTNKLLKEITEELKKKRGIRRARRGYIFN